MLTCRRCGGLTPPQASTSCLHCDEPLVQPPRWALKMAALLGPAGAILLAACYGAPGYYYNQHRPTTGMEGALRQDRDHDGAYGPWECGPTATPACPDYIARQPVPPDLDCNDNDPQIYPGAYDPEGDGIDQNCDGVDGGGSGRTYAPPPPNAPP